MLKFFFFFFAFKKIKKINKINKIKNLLSNIYIYIYIYNVRWCGLSYTPIISLERFHIPSSESCITYLFKKN